MSIDWFSFALGFLAAVVIVGGLALWVLGKLAECVPRIR